MRAGVLAKATAVACVVLALAACDSSNDPAGPGDVTVSEAKALDEAAEMIEARKAPPSASAADPAAPLPPEVPAPAATN